MPRRNRRPVPTLTSQKALDRWMDWCKETTENKQPQRTYLTPKKEMEVQQ